MNITEKHFWYSILFLTLVISLAINLNVAINTPIVFGDEGFYASRGEWVLDNLQIPKYYHIQSESEAYREFFLRPPELIFLVSSFFFLGGETLVKALGPIVNLILSLVIFLFVGKAYSYKTGVASVIFFSMIPSAITYTIFLYSEILAVLFVASAILFFYRGLTEEKRKKLFFVLGGILSGFALLTEIGSILLPLVFLSMFLIYRENWIKRFLLVLLIFIILIIPYYGIHNYYLLGNPGFQTERIGLDFPSRDILKDFKTSNDFELKGVTESAIGTGATIMNMGLLNYIQFAYALAPFIFAVIGASYMFMERKKENTLVLMLFFLFFFVALLVSTGRSEDAARAMLYTTVPLSIMAGVSVERIIKSIKSQDENFIKIVSIILVFIIFLFAMTSISAKTESLRPIKEFSPAFFEGCNWIRRNTPENSLLVTLWQHRAEYACKRDCIFTGAPGGAEMMLSGNERTYEIMKLHGADYVYIQKFSMSPGNEEESYPWVFVKYIRDSENFEKVHEYPENCMVSNIQDCVVIYKVL